MKKLLSFNTKRISRFVRRFLFIGLIQPGTCPTGFAATHPSVLDAFSELMSSLLNKSVPLATNWPSRTLGSAS